jgi:acetyl esterase/lipase
MKKTLIILLLYPFILIGQKLDYADEFAYEIHRNLDYAGNGNIRQALDIYIPHNRISDELPLVVYIHGGGFQRGSKNYAGRGMQYLRTGRYIFASINYRLSNEATILEMVYDCKAAIRYLKANAKKYGIDKNKIGVWGHSAGGHLAAMIGLTSASKALEGDVGYYKKENGSVACAVDADGPTDFESLKSVEEEYKNSPLFKSFFNNDMEAVKLASPITHADGSCIPFFIYHGVKDKAVSVKQSEELYDKLTKKGAKEIYFLKITDGGHVFSDERITQHMLNFFDRYLHDDKSVVVDDSEFSLN